MIFTINEVKAQCRIIAPEHNFEPKLIFAVCTRECEHRVVHGDKLVYDSTAYRTDKVRLEQNYYDRYVERQNELATSSEGLLAVSWGVMQEMGLELKRMGYFQFYFGQADDSIKNAIKEPLSQFAIPNALDAFAENLEWQIEWGCKLMAEKRTKAGGDITKMLTYWNGSSAYPPEVFKIYDKATI